MASIKEYRDGWRAQIYVGGVRESAVFKEKFEAQTWASRRESDLKAFKQAADNAKRVASSKHRFLENAGIYSEAEIIGTSTPIPETSGIYFLIKGDAVVYVGQSKNVHRRISDHLANKAFDRINVIECPTEDLTKLEMEYIRKLKPILNLVGKTSIGESDLMMGAVCQAF